MKRSRGGLRDIQLMRWLGFARYGEADPDQLQMMGAIAKEDQRAPCAGRREFLLHVRNEMHFAAGKPQDVLGRMEQVRIAAALGFAGTEGLLGVEQFMREYFRHTREVSSILSRFMADARPWRRLGEWLAPIFSHLMERDYRVGAPGSSPRVAAGEAAAATWPRCCGWPTWRTFTKSASRPAHGS